MTVETAIRYQEITGTIFKNGRFQYEASHKVSFDDNYEATFILANTMSYLRFFADVIRFILNLSIRMHLKL